MNKRQIQKLREIRRIATFETMSVAFPDGNGVMTKCGRHCAAKSFERKNRIEQAQQEANLHRIKEQQLREHNATLEVLLAEIAAGHNDPRKAVSEWLATRKLIRGW